MATQKIAWDEVYTFYDDETVKGKLNKSSSKWSKWDVMLDDDRNPDPDISGGLEEFLKLGKSYQVAIIVEDVESKQKVESNEVYTLFDDSKVNKKLTLLSKWDAMLDDGRNPDPDLDGMLDKFLQFGKSYHVKVTLEEV